MQDFPWQLLAFLGIPWRTNSVPAQLSAAVKHFSFFNLLLSKVSRR
jgi:hypothetical protein